MNVRAKFKGENGSLGYETGKIYELTFRTTYVIHIRIWNTTNGMCEYSSLKSFLKNWTIL